MVHVHRISLLCVIVCVFFVNEYLFSNFITFVFKFTLYFKMFHFNL
jgi:hypothetical protein